jgi:hypothetical protein
MIRVILWKRVHGDARALPTGASLRKGEDGMNAKRACLVALMMTLAGVGAARAQVYGSGPYGSPGSPPPSAIPGPAAVPGPVDAPVPPPTGPRLSEYILGTTPDCCGPTGGNGPISIEPYMRAGASVILPTGFLGKVLDTGWDIEGGARTLFFNTEGDAAWTLDLGMSNVNNHGQHSDRVATLNLIATDVNGNTGRFLFPVTVQALNRTFVNLAVGRECYLWAPAANCQNCGRMGDGPTWRIGIDGGGRWGTEMLQFHEIRHRTEVIEGAFASIHTDLEVPWGGWVFVAGARIEYDYTWMHQILQGLPENLQELNGLITLGVRY